jgi:hypothetical protein
MFIRASVRASDRPGFTSEPPAKGSDGGGSAPKIGDFQATFSPQVEALYITYGGRAPLPSINPSKCRGFCSMEGTTFATTSTFPWKSLEIAACAKKFENQVTGVLRNAQSE